MSSSKSISKASLKSRNYIWSSTILSVIIRKIKKIRILKAYFIILGNHKTTGTISLQWFLKPESPKLWAIYVGRLKITMNGNNQTSENKRLDNYRWMTSRVNKKAFMAAIFPERRVCLGMVKADLLQDKYKYRPSTPITNLILISIRLTWRENWIQFRRRHLQQPRPLKVTEWFT